MEVGKGLENLYIARVVRQAMNDAADHKPNSGEVILNEIAETIIGSCVHRDKITWKQLHEALNRVMIDTMNRVDLEIQRTIEQNTRGD